MNPGKVANVVSHSNVSFVSLVSVLTADDDRGAGAGLGARRARRGAAGIAQWIDFDVLSSPGRGRAPPLPCPGSRGTPLRG